MSQNATNSSADVSIKCTYCSSLNHSLMIECEICEKQLHNSDNNKIEEYKNENNIKCPSCTLYNNLFNDECIACGTILKKKRNIESTLYSLQSLSNQKSSSSSSSTSLSSSSIINSKVIFDSSAATNGIFELLIPLIKNQPKLHSFKLCTPCTHISQLETDEIQDGEDWTCGYRNIQMLCKSLMQVEEYRNVMFNGKGELPNVVGIQAYIEKAWEKGFDVDGCSSNRTLLNGNCLIGSKLWIGAVECAVLLRSFKLRAIIVDFDNSRKNQTNSTGDRIYNWISKYFLSNSTNKTNIDNNNQSSLQEVERIFFQNSKKIKNNDSHSIEINNKFHEDDTIINDDHIPPLFFQHSGHSRTIIGYEKKDKKSNLMLYDPAENGNILKYNLKKGNYWQSKFKRSTEVLSKKKQYQIVFVSKGLMNDKEYEDSKLIIGVSDSYKIMNKIVDYKTSHRLGFI
jgi:hypothetical protein